MTQKRRGACGTFLIYGILLGLLGACSKHPCDPVMTGSSWTSLELDKAQLVTCSSAVDKIQFHFLGSVPQTSAWLIKHFEGLGFKRLTQNLSQNNHVFVVSDGKQKLEIDIYEWDDGSGIIIRHTRE